VTKALAVGMSSNSADNFVTPGNAVLSFEAIIYWSKSVILKYI
jgi:hypothetical protein